MRVLVAIDLRDEIAPFMTQVTTWAQRLNAKVDLIYAEGYIDATALIRDPHVRALMVAEAEHLRKQDLKQLQGLVDALPEELRGDAHLVAANPAQTVIERATPYDAVLVGTHGRTGLAHFWLGSQAERIVRGCSKPVIVLRTGTTK